MISLTSRWKLCITTGSNFTSSANTYFVLSKHLYWLEYAPYDDPNVLWVFLAFLALYKSIGSECYFSGKSPIGLSRNRFFVRITSSKETNVELTIVNEFLRITLINLMHYKWTNSLSQILEFYLEEDFLRGQAYKEFYTIS
jgi:hypothetical protein